jgi:hypothetical protein
MGRSDGRQWGLSVAAYGEISMAAVTMAGELGDQRLNDVTEPLAALDVPRLLRQARKQVSQAPISERDNGDPTRRPAAPGPRTR